MVLLSQVIPAGLDAFFVCDRADQLVDGLKWLLGALPMVSSLAIKTALVGAARAAGLGGFDLLDPLDWKLRGFDLDKGLAIWALPEEKGGVLLVGVHRERDARETLRSLCSSKSEAEFQDLGDLTLIIEDGATAGVFGFFEGYLWLSFHATSSEEARATLTLIRGAFGGQVDEVARRVLAEAPGSPHALRVFAVADQVPFAAAIALLRNEIEITLRIDHLDDRDVLLFLATRSPERNLARFLPRGALAILSGIDLSTLLGDSKPSEPVPSLAVLRDIDPGIVPMLRRKASAEEILCSDTVRASFLARVNDHEPWKKIAAGAVETNGGNTLQRRDPLDGERTVYAIKRGEALVWVTFERGLMLVALSEPDLDEIRAAARTGIGGLESSIDDVEARRLLIDGEPLLHVKIADLTGRFSGLVSELWSERELASGLGVRELLNFLAKMPDATAQFTPDAPEAGSGVDAWLKLRVR